MPLPEKSNYTQSSSLGRFHKFVIWDFDREFEKIGSVCFHYWSDFAKFLDYEEKGLHSWYSHRACKISSLRWETGSWAFPRIARADHGEETLGNYTHEKPTCVPRCPSIKVPQYIYTRDSLKKKMKKRRIKTLLVARRHKRAPALAYSGRFLSWYYQIKDKRRQEQRRESEKERERWWRWCTALLYVERASWINK